MSQNSISLPVTYLHFRKLNKGQHYTHTKHTCFEAAFRSTKIQIQLHLCPHSFHGNAYCQKRERQSHSQQVQRRSGGMQKIACQFLRTFCQGRGLPLGGGPRCLQGITKGKGMSFFPPCFFFCRCSFSLGLFYCRGGVCGFNGRLVSFPQKTSVCVLRERR